MNCEYKQVMFQFLVMLIYLIQDKTIPLLVLVLVLWCLLVVALDLYPFLQLR